VPFQSEAQRRYLYANEPEVARRWQKKTPKGADLPPRVGKLAPEGGIPSIPAGKMLGKQVDTSRIHTLCFDKKAFHKKRAVRVWLRLNEYRLAHVSDGGDEWCVRQDSPDVGNMGESRVAVHPGVEAIIGVPKRISKGMGFSPLPLMPPIGGASGPSNHTPEMPDFQSIYAGPEAQKRQAQEAEQSEDRRRSVWRDFNFAGFHGTGAPDEPTLRYIDGETSTADVAVTQPRHFLTAEQLRQHQKRVQEGAAIGYDVVQGQTGKRKKGKVG
jgi:hypothetical protein